VPYTLSLVPLTRTYRDVDGERIEGSCRLVFVRNGSSYFLTELLVFADGAIWLGDEWVDVGGLWEVLRSGRVATSLEPGRVGVAHHLASWRFTDPQVAVTAEELLGEVTDEIERLNNRPDSTERCQRALERFLRTRAEPDRIALREAYEAVPAHLRIYLGEMGVRDWPLWALCADSDEFPGGVEEAERRRQEAFEYFSDKDRKAMGLRRKFAYADGPDGADTPTLHLSESHARDWPAELGTLALTNEYPAPIVVSSVTYATVVHAYWALSTSDLEAREQIRGAARWSEAQELAARAQRRPDWAEARVAVMAGLLRAKFRQHPQLADVLIGTGDARIHYRGGSRYWHSGPRAHFHETSNYGRNWVGRLLELIRAEFIAERSGIPLI
jgi:predicted NAD-dependent protein-ADP-ribosyltransferase YbiA (DUF1768 family)